MGGATLAAWRGTTKHAYHLSKFIVPWTLSTLSVILPSPPSLSQSPVCAAAAVRSRKSLTVFTRNALSRSALRATRKAVRARLIRVSRVASASVSLRCVHQLLFSGFAAACFRIVYQRNSHAVLALRVPVKMNRLAFDSACYNCVKSSIARWFVSNDCARTVESNADVSFIRLERRGP